MTFYEDAFNRRPSGDICAHFELHNHFCIGDPQIRSHCTLSKYQIKINRKKIKICEALAEIKQHK